MNVLFSCNKIAGTLLTEVAVGTFRLASMLVTTRAEVPRIVSVTASFEVGTSITFLRIGTISSTGFLAIGSTTGVEFFASFAIFAAFRSVGE